MIIRHCGLLDNNNNLEVIFEGVPDGTTITLSGSAGDLGILTVSDGKILFKKMENGDYILRMHLPDGTRLFAGFTISGKEIKNHHSTFQNLVMMWDVISDFAKRIDSVDKKISKITDGYITE